MPSWRLRPRHVVVALVTAVLATMTFAGPASAATVGSTITVTHLSNNALRITYAGHSYICYYGDLCIYRGGSYEAYYACRTVANSTTSNGWAINNQYGSGGTATFYARSGSNGSLGVNRAAGVYWANVKSFRICT
jgi:hypothetical protein